MLPELVFPSPPTLFVAELTSLRLVVDALDAAAWKFYRSNFGVEYCSSEVCAKDEVAEEDYFCNCWWT